jgi:hypothetical protein
MFNRQTLFVVGSGASADVGMPVGTQLASKIGKKLDIRFELGGEHIGSGDLELFQHIRSAFRENAREYQHVGWLIRDGIALSQSIDDFLDLHPCRQQSEPLRQGCNSQVHSRIRKE